LRCPACLVCGASWEEVKGQRARVARMAREYLPFHCARADVMTSSAVAQRHSAPLPRRPPEDLKPLSSRTAACRLQRSNRCGTSLRMATPLLPRPPHPRPFRGPPPPQRDL
jgi:hypothetical protein